MYQPFDHIFFRMPAFPFCLQNDSAKIVELALFQEALYLASPSLYNDIYKYSEKRVLYALVRYINRMSTRCTPFGLFAGCSIGKLCVTPKTTSLIVRKEIQKHIRLDMSFLCKISGMLIQNKEIRDCVYFFSNSTLYKVGKKIRFMEKDAECGFQISTIEYSLLLKQILNRAHYGIKRKELIDFLINQGALENDAMDYADALIDSQILISEISPAVTGQNYLSKIIGIVGREKVINKISLLVQEIDTELKKMNDYSAPQSYQHFISLLKSYGLNHEESRLFQVDMTRKAIKTEVNQEVITELNKFISLLCKKKSKNKSFHLQQFTDKFYERYGESEVPLLEVLDPEIGLGYPLYTNKNYLSPLLKDFQLPLRGNKKRISELDSFYCKLSQKVINAISLKKDVYLTDNDMFSDEIDNLEMPSTVGIMCEIFQKRNNSTQIYLKSIGGGCGNNLLARFAYMDNDIENFVKEIAAAEQLSNQDVIYAEISYLPEERLGNVLCRPHIREHEIVLLTSSDLPRKKIIYLSDLLLSYQNGNLLLKSKKNKKRICPRLTTAHNFISSEVPIYHFLCDMQTQEPNIYFSLNQNLLLSQFGFIPRINYGNIILSLATWSISIKDIKRFFLMQDPSELINELCCWRNTISMPQHCLLKDGDNTLYVDWNDFDIIQSFFTIVKNRESVYLSEFIFCPNSAVVRDEEGNPYLNECIFIFKKKNNASSTNIYTRK